MREDKTLVELFGELPYRTLVKEIKDFAIFHLDSKGFIVSWNEGAERLFGYTETEVINQDFSLIFTPEDRESGVPKAELRKAETNGRAEDVRWHLRKNGSRFYADGVTAVLRDENGKLLGFAKIARDDTERKQAEEMLLERTRLATLNGDIGSALIEGDDLQNLLNRCAEILVKHLDAAFARIWTFNKEENILELRASAGIYTHLDGLHSRIPIGKFKIGLIAEERLPHLTNDVLSDPHFTDKVWAEREGIKAFAGYPMIVEDRLVGVMCVFAQHPLMQLALEAMASVSNAIANAIERKQTEKAFRESEEQYRIVAETASDVIISINEKSVILFINSTAKKIFGYDTAQLLGQPLTMLMPGYLRDVHKAGLGRYIKTGKRHLDWQHIEVTGLHRDGHEFPLELSFGEFNKNDEHIFIGIARDISERKRVEAEREQLLQREQAARLQAEEANRLKDEFLATLSHELRTPLTAILGWAQMLKAGKLEKSAGEKALATIERNARAQTQLIDDLLDVSRIITGKLRLDVRAVDLSAVVMSAVDAARPAVEAKGIRLQTLLDPQAGPISGDPDRLQQVVWNLLSNAVKFTPKGGRVQVRLERVNSHVEIVISDTGKGIEPEFLPHVFDRFRQSDGSSSRRHGGLGLGLAIARQLIELHGGIVSVESAGEGQGSTFTVDLPLLPVRREAAESGAARVHPAARVSAVLDCSPELEGLHILLVDDEADSRELLNTVIGSCGARVKTANSAAEAFEIIQSEPFDVIISDIGMPEEDGFELINKIRGLPVEKGGNVPAIALTAYARIEDRIKALRSGFQMHVSKPVEPSELIVVVANLAGRTSRLGKEENQ